jgi:hypothetical protein
MIERNLLDQTKDLRPPQRDGSEQLWDGGAKIEQRRIAEQGLSQNERVGGDRKRCQDFQINLNQPYCCLITLQEENFLEVVAV